MFDKEAIQELSQAQAIGAASIAVNTAERGAVALPNDFTLHDLERYMPTRRRARGTMSTSSIEDFAAYVLAHREEGTSVFIDQDGMQAVAVLNLGTVAQPGHADNRAQLAPKRTAAYTALLRVTSGGQKQATIAEFLEDWAPYLTCSNDVGGIETKQAIAAVRKITIEAMSKSESAVNQLSVSRGALESVAATGIEKLPTRIEFFCEPYHGLSNRAFAMRLGIQTGDTKPSILLTIINAEQHAEDMAIELADSVRTALQDQIPCMVGKYAATA